MYTPSVSSFSVLTNSYMKHFSSINKKDMWMVRHHREGFEKEDVRVNLHPILDQLCDFEGVTVYL